MMKILLTSIGTRGDKEPLLALGEKLQAKGHHVQYAFPAQFASLVQSDVDFLPLCPQMLELIESEEGRVVMGKAPLITKVRALFRLYQRGKGVNNQIVQQHAHWMDSHSPDLIIYNSKCSYPLLWGMNMHRPTILLSPVPCLIHYVEGHAHVGIDKNLGTTVNKWSYRLLNYGLVKTIFDIQSIVTFKKKFSKAEIRKALLAQKMIYTISPTLFKRPKYWKENVQIVGYHERQNVKQWNPSPVVRSFLSRNPKVLFLTFGSMVNNHIVNLSNMMYRVLDELKIPTIINTASGGLCPSVEYEGKESFIFTETIPYDWILPRVYGIIHHGGSGTTHLGIKYGCPTLIIPHIFDQYGWNEWVSSVGVGPLGVSVNKIKEEDFREQVKDLYYNSLYKQKARVLQDQMKKEQMEEMMLEIVTSYEKK